MQMYAVGISWCYYTSKYAPQLVLLYRQFSVTVQGSMRYHQSGYEMVFIWTELISHYLRVG